MSALRLRLSGLNSSDANSIRSMLRLSSDLLSQPWAIVDEGPAELVIYSFDTERGQQAWEQREPGFTALLTQTGNVTAAVDIVLRKPLRKSNFSEALNLIEEQLRQQRKVAQPQTSLKPANTQRKDWSKKLLETFRLKKKPASHLPELEFASAEQPSQQTDTITDASLLQTWVSQLPKDAGQRTSTLLKNLTPLNALALKPIQLLELLEIYHSAIHDLLFTRDITTVKRDLYVTPESQRAIQAMAQLLTELTIGYQQLARHYYERGDTPSQQPMLLFTLNRSAELMAYSLLHAFQYYRRAPMGIWQRLHQLYLYHEKANTLHQLPALKQPYQVRCFSDIYAQILLTAVADPYSLPRFEVFKLSTVMEQFSDEIETGMLSDKQINTTSNFLLTGHYCIDTRSDHAAKPMVKTDISLRQQATTRLLNTQPALLRIEQQLNAAKQRAESTVNSDLRLLKKIVPQLNTTHERRYHRLTSGKHRTVKIAHGLRAIHQSMTDSPTAALIWQMENQSSGGLMARHNTEGCYHLNIGDVVGIFEQELTVKLATVRWLHIELDGETTIGLELIEGKPVPVFCSAEAETERYPALLLPASKEGKASALITEKGLYSPGRRLSLVEEETLLIETSTLLESTLDYEQFNFKAQRGS